MEGLRRSSEFNRTEINKLLQDNHVKDQLKEILSDKALMEARIELAVRGEYPFVFTEDVYAAFDDVVDDGGDMLRELSKWGKEQLLQEVHREAERELHMKTNRLSNGMKEFLDKNLGEPFCELRKLALRENYCPYLDTTPEERETSSWLKDKYARSAGLIHKTQSEVILEFQERFPTHAHLFNDDLKAQTIQTIHERVRDDELPTLKKRRKASYWAKKRGEAEEIKFLDEAKEILKASESYSGEDECAQDNVLEDNAEDDSKQEYGNYKAREEGKKGLDAHAMDLLQAALM